MQREEFDVVVVGGGQSGLAMSEHLGARGISHVILERHRIAERWRSERWDSLVANGPAWHDRFPTLEFGDVDPDGFASKESVAAYFETFAKQIGAPIRCGVEVTGVAKNTDGNGFIVQTSEGVIEARNVVAATGPFQTPIIPPIIPKLNSIEQLHSNAYHRPSQLNEGAVLVVGAGSSGSQIADELLRSNREVYLSVGPHDRPPRSYRGKDFVYWLNVLGKWQMPVVAGKEHVTIAVSGAYGGHTIDFRKFAERGMNIVGMTKSFENGVLSFQNDIVQNIADGDANYLGLLDEADEYVAKNGLDYPLEPDARTILDDPTCLSSPTLELDLAEAGITSIIWATGYQQDFGWLDLDTFDADGRPRHEHGISEIPGIYFLGLPWLTMRGSSFIWGVWEDAKHLAEHISKR